jgi:endonuclease YncB( thermonuclease family)
MTEAPQLARVLVGGVLIAGLAVALIGHFTTPPVVQEPSPAPPSVAGADSAAKPQQRPVRDVTPQGVARVYMPPQASGQRTPGVARSMQITHAGVMPNGSIVGDGHTVRLYGVAFPDVKKICATASGERWPCGRRAYIALHNKVVAQTVSCEPRAAADSPAADCFLGEVNLAAWLLSQGLVRLLPDVADTELMTAEAAARKTRLGLWSDSGELAPSASAQGE